MNNRVIVGNKDQMLLYAQSIDERLARDHEVYAFDRLIEGIGLSELERLYSTEGGKVYDPRMMTKILFYGYHRGIRSSRKLSQACAEILPFIYLAGGLKIKFRAIAAFRRRAEDVLPGLFAKIVQAGVDMRLATGRKVFQDGTKIRASASNEGMKKKKEWAAERDALLKDVERYLAAADVADAEEDAIFGTEAEDDSKAAQEKRRAEMLARVDAAVVAERKRRQAEIKAEKESAPLASQSRAVCARAKAPQGDDADPHLDWFEKASKVLKIESALGQNADADAETKLSLVDPDCRFIKGGGKIETNYNVQIMTENQFVLAADVSNEAADQTQLEYMAKQRDRNLPAEKMEHYAGDAGYFSGKNLKFLSEKGVDAYIPEHSSKSNAEKWEDDAFAASKFQAGPDDVLVCPAEKLLTRAPMRNDDIVHRSSPGICMLCGFREQCFKTEDDRRLGYRTIRRDDLSFYREAMREKMKSPEAKPFYKRRCVEPEPVFGQLKHNKGLRGFLLRGLSGVRIETLLAFGAHNLGKIMTFLRMQETAEMTAST